MRLDELPQEIWDNNRESIIRAPYDYLDSQAGKNVRQRLILAFNHWLNVPPENLEIIGQVVSILHTSSLLVDDIEDFASLRRGNPVAHSVFGVPQTLNSANYMYFVALDRLNKLQQLAGTTNTDIYRIFIEEMMSLHRGQGLDVYWRDTLTVPAEEEYASMVLQKTGGLFRLAVRLMQNQSSAGDDVKNDPYYTRIADMIGLLFQIKDDYLNLQSHGYTINKGFCEDLSEGKLSFPVVHSLNTSNSEQKTQLLNILRQKTRDIDLKKYALDLLDKNGSLQYTRQEVDKVYGNIKILMQNLEKNPLLEKFLQEIAVT